MKQDTASCDFRRIEDYLEDKLSEAEESSLLEHLNDCSKCRDRMQCVAAEPVTWEEANQFLTDEDFDCADPTVF